MNNLVRKELSIRNLKTEIESKKNQPDRVKLGKLGTGFAAASLLVSCLGEDSNPRVPVSQKNYAITDGGTEDLATSQDFSVIVTVDMGGSNSCKGNGKPIFSSGRLVFCYTEPETSDMNWSQCLVNCKVKGYGYKMITKEDTYYLCMLGGSTPLAQKTLFSVRIGEMQGSAVALNPENLRPLVPGLPQFPYNDEIGLTMGTDLGSVNMDGGIPASGWSVCDSWKDLDKLKPETFNFSPTAATGNSFNYGTAAKFWTDKIGCMCGKEME